MKEFFPICKDFKQNIFGILEAYPFPLHRSRQCLLQVRLVYHGRTVFHEYRKRQRKPLSVNSRPPKI